MRAPLVVGLALFAGMAGYGLSFLRNTPQALESNSEMRSAAASALNTPSLAEPLVVASASVEKASSALSFKNERPNTATMTDTADSSLPPETMPLAQSADTLVAAMRAGSRAATLRLLRQTKLCARFRGANTTLEFALSAQDAAKSPGGGGLILSMPPKGDEPPPTLSGLVTSSATEVAANAAICAGFEDPQKIVEFEAQWRAALMGEVDGLLEFSLNPAIDAFHAYEQADRIERYRERVLGFMHEAMAQHSAQAVANLMHAYDPGWVPMHIRGRSSNSSPMNVFLDSIKNPEPLRQVSGADAVLAYRYARLCQAVCPEFPRSEAEVVAQRLRGELEGAERERADADANRLRAQHFADAARAPWIEDIGEQRETAVSPGKG